MKSMLYKLLGILLLLDLQCHAQTDSTKPDRKSIDIEVSIQGAVEGVFFAPSVSWYRKRHLLSLGPRINLTPVVNDKGWRGALLTYKYFPNLRPNRINFFFSVHTDYYYEPTKGSYSNSIQHKSNEYLNLTVGYGFQITFAKRAYFLFDLGIGLGVGRTRYYDAPNVSSVDITGMIQGGFGYRIFR